VLRDVVGVPTARIFGVVVFVLAFALYAVNWRARFTTVRDVQSAFRVWVVPERQALAQRHVREIGTVLRAVPHQWHVPTDPSQLPWREDG
jgi:hypothetical protein